MDGHSWLYFGNIGCIQEKGLYSRKFDILGQYLWYSGKLGVIGQSGCIWAKWLYSGKVVVLG